jgi:hypothetical protein
MERPPAPPCFRTPPSSSVPAERMRSSTDRLGDRTGSNRIAPGGPSGRCYMGRCEYVSDARGATPCPSAARLTAAAANMKQDARMRLRYLLSQSETTGRYQLRMRTKWQRVRTAKAGHGHFSLQQVAEHSDSGAQFSNSAVIVCLVRDEPAEEANQRHADSNHFEYRSRAPRVPLDLADHVEPVYGCGFSPANSRSDRGPDTHNSASCQYRDSNDAKTTKENVDITHDSCLERS